MTHSPITHVDLVPEFSTMTTAALESLADRAFNQLEDGPAVEGLYAFYLCLTAEIEDRIAKQRAVPETGTDGQVLKTAV